MLREITGSTPWPIHKQSLTGAVPLKSLPSMGMEIAQTDSSIVLAGRVSGGVSWPGGDRRQLFVPGALECGQITHWCKCACHQEEYSLPFMLTVVIIIHDLLRICEKVLPDVVLGQIRHLVGLGLALALVHASRGAELDHATQLACDFQAGLVDDEVESPNGTPSSD